MRTFVRSVKEALGIKGSYSRWMNWYLYHHV